MRNFRKTYTGNCVCVFSLRIFFLSCDVSRRIHCRCIPVLLLKKCSARDRRRCCSSSSTRIRFFSRIIIIDCTHETNTVLRDIRIILGKISSRQLPKGRGAPRLTRSIRLNNDTRCSVRGPGDVISHCTAAVARERLRAVATAKLAYLSFVSFDPLFIIGIPENVYARTEPRHMRDAMFRRIFFLFFFLRVNSGTDCRFRS